jgi:hypothetical protein
MLGGVCWSVHGQERLLERCGLTAQEFVYRLDPRTERAILPGAVSVRVGSMNAELVLEWIENIGHVVTVKPIKEGVKKKRLKWERDDE